MSDIKYVLKMVKENPNTKQQLIQKKNALDNLTKGEKASLTDRLMADKVVYEEAIIIMGQGINEAEIEIEALEHKNSLLEKELNIVDKQKINAAYETKKFELENDNKANSRVMKRLESIMSKSKQLTNK
jgi:hypothetical protein